MHSLGGGHWNVEKYEKKEEKRGKTANERKKEER
jgi:hypothetical protein